ncbi:hypothetical protein [Streptomyces sp. NBC_00620]|uniref:hypothetical protein n=1 Tax=Streptomyces sp. NBC_00620 TaxID=2903666 RepID=UPI00225738E5|nr:hypothetical protein [Streptomyces sp. NBC_00620]MCX4976449.1 hypothetical protein [Streptomyces sp. NBC_00620]
MTRYGFAIKALPKGGQPFGDEDDEKAGAEEDELGGADLGAPAIEPPTDPAEDPGANTDPADPAGPPGEDAAISEEGGSELSGEAPPPPADDARPWSGDMYDEGDETDPEGAFAAYTGSEGEQAWLDQAPDGTLTGWVRDSTGQVWRYNSPDTWAIEVDDAQMTRTHSRAEESGAAGPAAPSDPAQPNDRGVQDSMFANQ